MAACLGACGRLLPSAVLPFRALVFWGLCLGPWLRETLERMAQNRSSTIHTLGLQVGISFYTLGAKGLRCLRNNCRIELTASAASFKQKCRVTNFQQKGEGIWFGRIRAWGSGRYQKALGNNMYSEATLSPRGSTYLTMTPWPNCQFHEKSSLYWYLDPGRL